MERTDTQDYRVDTERISQLTGESRILVKLMFKVWLTCKRWPNKQPPEEYGGVEITKALSAALTGEAVVDSDGEVLHGPPRTRNQPWRDFEASIRESLESSGFEVEHGQTIDFIATRGRVRILVECKNVCSKSAAFSAISQILFYRYATGDTSHGVVVMPGGLRDERVAEFAKTNDIRVF